MHTDRGMGNERGHRTTRPLSPLLHSGEGHLLEIAARTDPANGPIGFLTAQRIGAALQGGGHHRHVQGRCDGRMGRVVGALKSTRPCCSTALQIRTYSRKWPSGAVRERPMACMLGR